jgi:hypothetical protein
VDDLTRALKEGRAVFQDVPPDVDARRVRPQAHRSIGHRTLSGSPIHSGVFRGARLLDPDTTPREEPSP